MIFGLWACLCSGGFHRIRGLSAGQSIIGDFVVIFWPDGGSFNQPGVHRRFHVPKPVPLGNSVSWCELGFCCGISSMAGTISGRCCRCSTGW